MLLATLLQLHILLSAAPALAGWTPLGAALPAAPGQAIYGLSAASPRALPMQMQAHFVRARSGFAVHGLLLPASLWAQPTPQSASSWIRTSAPSLQTLLRPMQKPRAP